jgi:hypothetical protein
VSDIIAEITAARRKRSGAAAAEPKERKARVRKIKVPDPTDPAVVIAAMSREEKLQELDGVRAQLTAASHQARAELLEDTDLTQEYEADLRETEEPDEIGG